MDIGLGIFRQREIVQLVSTVKGLQQFRGRDRRRRLSLNDVRACFDKGTTKTLERQRNLYAYRRRATEMPSLSLSSFEAQRSNRGSRKC